MKTTIGQVIEFGKNGDAREFQIYGWSLAEDGFTWTDGSFAGLMLPTPEAPHGFFVELFFGVHGFPDGTGSQRIVVSVNGREIGHSVARGRMRLAWRAPRLAPTDARLVINFALPDAVKPSHGKDPRHLGLCATSLRIIPLLAPFPDFVPRLSATVPAPDANAAKDLAERITGLTAGQLAMKFESLGVNCEPGFFQRKCGVEPLSLLRFSGVVLYSLVQSIDDGFAGLGDIESIDPVPDEADLKDWIIYERRHLMRYHTFVRVADATVDELKLREKKRLPFLRRKFLEDLDSGEKIFVHQHNRLMADEELLPLFLAIRRRGTGTLLCIGPADTEHPVGLVKEIFPGLMRGYFSHFSAAGKELSMTEWLAVCGSAWLLAGAPWG